MPSRPTGLHRSRSRPIALLLTLTSLFTLAPLPPTPSASAAGQTMYWDEGGVSFTEFGPNAAITIGMGTMDYVTACSRSSGVKDFLYAWTDIYVVPAGSVSTGSALSDISGAPNSVQGVGGGLFMGETIGYTAPGGTVGAGEWAVVYDECQDGFFDAEDALFDPAFRVTVPAGSIPDLPGLAELKADAQREEQEWKRFHKALSMLFKFAAKRDKGNAIQKWIGKAHKWGLVNDPRQAALAHVLNVASRYKGIAADPPDPQFQQVTLLEPREVIDPLGEDPFWYWSSFLGSHASAEETVAEALLHGLERYQGAQAANNPNWALVHAQQIQDYANYLDIQLGRTNQALQQFASAVTADPRSFEAEAAEWQAFQARVAAEGFTEEELRDFRHLGLTDAEIEQARQDLLADDFAYTNAGFVAQVNGLIALNNDLSDDMQQLWTAMQPIVAELQSHPSYAPFAPLADAGGPYVYGEGNTITLNGSGSQSPTPITSYEWDTDLDGLFDDATGVSPSVTLGRSFQGFVGLKVTNNIGATNVAYAPASVADVNGPPVITGYTPAPLFQTLDVGATATFTVSADELDGEPISITWQLNDTEVGAGDSFTWTATAAQLGAHQLHAMVSDNSPLGGATRLTWQVDVLYPDQDGDGWRQNLDCRDVDAAVNPGQPEIPGNGMDDDCDPATSDEAPLVITAPGNQVAREGTPSTFALGTLAGTAAGPYTVTVDWGDGSTPDTFNVSGLGAIPDQTHTYADNGTYDISVSATPAAGEPATAGFAASVANLAPQATLVAPTATSVGGWIPVELTDVTDPSPVDQAAGFYMAFECGAGTGYGPMGPLTSGGCLAPDVPTAFAIRVKLVDKDGGESEFSTTVQVQAEPESNSPTALFSPNGSGRNVALAEYGATIHSSSGQYGTSYTSQRMLTLPTNDSYWATPSGQTSGWAKIELGGTTPVLIDRILLMPSTHSTERVKDFEVAVSVGSADEADFTTVLTATAASSSTLQEFTLPQPVLAKYIKYSPLNNRGAACCVATQAFHAISSQFGEATVTFQNRSTDPDGDLTGYHWDFGDGNTSTEASPTHTYAAAGTYNVTLTATDADGNSNTITLPYTVLQPPTAAIAVTTPQPLEGSTVFFTASASDPDGGAIASYGWTWGDGTSNSPGNASINHRYPDNGIYTVTLTVTDDQGQTASTQTTVTVANVPPTGSAGSNQSTPWGLSIAPSGPSYTDASGTDRQTLDCRWDLGDGTLVGPGRCSDSSILRPAHVYADPGVYTRTLTITDKDGASQSYTSQVTVTERATRVIYQGPRTAGAGDPINLRARIRDLVTEEAVVGETVTFRVAGEVVSATTDAAGIATATLSSLPEGDYPVDIEYAGSAYYKAHTAYDRLIVGVADDALVTTSAILSPTELVCQTPAHVTLGVTGVPPTTSSVPLDVALVIDLSGSMSGAKLTAAKAAARQFVQIVERESDGVQDGTIRGSQIAVVPFDSNAWIDTNLTGDATLLEQRIQSLSLGGSTAVHAGINAGRDELVAGAKPGNKPIMVVLSDGGSNHNLAFQAANAAKAAGIEVFSIALGTGADQVLMEGIASDPKDEHYFLSPTPEELEQIYETIAQTATGPAATNLAITVEVYPTFALDPASITPAPDSVSGNQITWNLAELTGETRYFTYQATHLTSAGSLPVQSASLTYTDTQGDQQTKPFPALVADVSCTPILTYLGDLEGRPGESATLSSRLNAPDGPPLAGQTLTFDLGGLTATAQTGSDGIATTTVVLNLPPGIYDLNTLFAGGGGYLPVDNPVAFVVRAGEDNQAPTTTITPAGTDGENGWFTSPVTVTLSAIDLPSGTSDGVAATEYSLDGGATWQAYTGPFVLTDDGVHTVLARSTDTAGNQEEPPVSREIAIDQAAPEVTANPVTGDEGTPVVLSAVASDATAGIARVEWDLDGDSTYETEGASITHTWPDNGSYTVKVRATDRAGHQTEGTAAVEIANVAPTVTAPADQTAQAGAATTIELGSFADPGENDLFWSFTVDWGDGSPNLVESALAPGSLGTFDHTYAAPGAYTVTVTVTDKDGASDSAAFTVTAGDVAPCEPFGWKPPLGGADPAEVSLADTLTIAFSYGCEPFIRDESVIITVYDAATQEEITAWVYGLDIEIDDAAGEYRVLFEPAFYGLAAGQELQIIVFMTGEAVGETEIRITD